MPSVATLTHLILTTAYEIKGMNADEKTVAFREVKE